MLNLLIQLSLHIYTLLGSIDNGRYDFTKIKLLYIIINLYSILVVTLNHEKAKISFMLNTVMSCHWSSGIMWQN